MNIFVYVTVISKYMKNFATVISLTVIIELISCSWRK